MFHQVYTFTSSAWYFDKILAYYFVYPILKLGFNITYKLVDNQILEGLGPYWISNFLANKARLTSYYRRYIYSYLFLFIVSITCFVIQL